jgi:hypothetical protein
LSRRSRIVGFGSAGLLVLAGIACAVLFGGGLGQNLAFALVALGMVGGTALVFYEVGLTEDRDRARSSVPTASEVEGGRSEPEPPPPEPPPPEERPRSRGAQRPHPDERPGRVRLERMRGRPRRLR